MPAAEEKPRRRLSPEERKALKARQEELRREAIRAKARQFYRIANVVAVAGTLLALLGYLAPFYNDEAEKRRGDQLARQVVETGRAFVSTGRTLVRSEEREATPAQHLLAVLPFGLAAMLLLFAVDAVEPLGGGLQVLGMLYAVGASVVVFSVSFWRLWPGVLGVPLVPVLLGLFVMFVGSMAALPGSVRRLREREEAAGAAALQTESSRDAGHEGVPGGG